MTSLEGGRHNRPDPVKLREAAQIVRESAYPAFHCTASKLESLADQVESAEKAQADLVEQVAQHLWRGRELTVRGDGHANDWEVHCPDKYLFRGMASVLIADFDITQKAPPTPKCDCGNEADPSWCDDDCGRRRPTQVDVLGDEDWHKDYTWRDKHGETHYYRHNQGWEFLGCPTPPFEDYGPFTRVEVMSADLTDDEVDEALALSIYRYDKNDKYPEWSNHTLREAYRAGLEDGRAESGKS